MRKPPLVAIVGRPNVGKSTLFNRFVGFRKALVHDRPGLTRDRNYALCTWEGRSFRVVDTGGLLGGAEDRLLEQGIGEQAFLAMGEARLILLVVDARDGLTPLDEELAGRVRQLAKPVLLVVNKVDGPRVELTALEFHRLGWEDLFLVSAEHRLGLQDLIEAVAQRLGLAEPSAAGQPESLRLAIVGRPNAGKSTLVNRICGEERVLVNPLPGTTRDAVDVAVAFRGRTITLVDTAGIRKKARIQSAEEHLSVSMAIRAIERADIAVLLLDGMEGVGSQDVAIAGQIERSGRGVIIAVNKWDLAPAKTHQAARELTEEIRNHLRFLEYAPLILVSALEGTRIIRLLEEALAVDGRLEMRVPTRRLNKLLARLIAERQPPGYQGHPARIYYATQVASRPPAFQLFLNRGGRLHFSYRRYLVNRLREEFDLAGVPVRLLEAPKPSRSG